MVHILVRLETNSVHRRGIVKQYKNDIDWDMEYRADSLEDYEKSQDIDR